MSKPKSPLQEIVEKYIEIFYKYTGNTKSLDKEAFKKLIDEQFPDIAESPFKKEIRDQVFAEADANKDNKLDFYEVSQLIARYIAETYEKVRK